MPHTEKIAAEEHARKKAERKAQKAKDKAKMREGIIKVPRPKGIAGDRKRGFVLSEAMGVDEEKYRACVVSIFATSSHIA